MYDNERAEDRERRRRRAGEHPLRRAILALLGDGSRKLPTTAICAELSDAPSLSTVAYHLRVLVDAELIKADGDPGARVYSLA